MKAKLEELLRKWEAQRAQDEAFATEYDERKVIDVARFFAGKADGYKKCIDEVKQIIATL